jgi:hypothetical protein
MENLRLSHPNLYRSFMTFALISIGLGFNFIFAKPTFNAYDIPKLWIGIVFLSFGISKIFFLNILYNLKIVRILMSLSVAFKIFWGVGTSLTFFTGQTSLQLFVLYVGLAMLELFMLIEPSFNPMSSRKESDARLE